MPDRPPSLEPMQRGLTRILGKESSDRLRGVSINPKKVVLVAGTNGKGSTCATLETLLLASGQTVGLYTSPHLMEPTERIRINGKDILKQIFCDLYRDIAEKTMDLNLSHFEVLTLMAVSAFFLGQFYPPVSWAIFEVGLGGTWDATNAIPHQTCVITPLGLDHQNLLGNSLLEISKNKFGIISKKNTVIHTVLPKEVQPLADKIKTDTESQWIESAPFQLKVDTQFEEPLFEIQTPWGTAPLALVGERGAQNTATALTAFHQMGFDPSQVLSSLAQVNWPGRMQKVDRSDFKCPIYFSGDHNPHGVQSLIKLLKYYSYENLWILAGVGKEKNLDGILEPLFECERSHVLLTQTPFRGRTIQDYGAWLEKAHSAYQSPLDALQTIRTLAKPKDKILVTGSLYLVGFVMAAN